MISDNSSFVISGIELKNRSWSNTTGLIQGVTTITSSNEAKNDHGEDFNYAKSVYYQVFLTDSEEVIRNMMHRIIYGKWTFVKRGENFGIKLVKVLPGIHKSIMRIAEKEIFRS